MVLINLTETSRYRTNLGLANLGEDPLTATVELLRADGNPLATVTATVDPYSSRQLNRVLAGTVNVDDAYAVITAGSEQASYLAYASVVDNFSGDPTYIPAQPPPQF